MGRNKRYYSVKEASEILGVSTNTIYSYLDKGTVRAKRFGRGRFKILSSELTPYLAPMRKAGRLHMNFNFNFNLKNSIFQGLLGYDKGYEVKGNFIFWRIYLAYFMLAVGMMHLFWHFNIFFALPLIIGGVATLYIAENWEEHLLLSFWINIFDLLSLALASVMAFFGGQQYMLLFLIPTSVTVLAQAIMGINKLSRESSLASEFVNSLLIGIIVFGALSFLTPSFLPMKFMQDIISMSRVSFLLLLILAALPVIYVRYTLSKWHAKVRSHLELVVFPFYGVMSLIVASIYLNLGIWDMAYASFFYAFLAFVVIWFRKAGTISAYRKSGLLLTFGWIGIAIIMGIFSMFIIQDRLKASVLSGMGLKIDAVVDNINNEFIVSEGVVSNFVNDSNLQAILAGGNKAGAEEFTEALYNRLSSVNRVLVYDNTGIAIGVYPRNSLVEGTNFSSREYFQIAKSSTKPYISNIFVSVVNTKVVMYTIPIFGGGRFLGEVGVAYNLPMLSEKFQTSNPSGQIFAIDRLGNFVLNLDETKLGQKPPAEITGSINKDSFQTDSQLFSCSSAGVPEWRVCKVANINDITQALYITNIVVIIFLFVNAIQSLRVGFSLSEKNKMYV